jgi:S-adenosylmethionine:tRNA ribosyltransferase-isomerase
MHPRELSIADFTYDLPEARIAQQPLADRDASKLLVVGDGAIVDHAFSELPALIPPGTLLVLNDTRVVNARLVFHRETGARIEVLCLEPADGRPVELAFRDRGTSEWQCFIGNAKRWKEGEVLRLSEGELVLRVSRVGPERIRFSWSPAECSFAEILARVGHVPLPPYMKRPDADADKERYNTVFARHEGSVAAPTASLHFTQEVLDGLKKKNVRTTALTLHVGAGTFLPVKSERMQDHAMHHEQVRIPLTVLEALAGQVGNGLVVTVGTTALRTMESIYWHGVKLLKGGSVDEMDVSQWEPYDVGTADLPSASDAIASVIRHLRSRGEERLVGRTQLLIAPGYAFRYADGLITNFHQPGSTLLLLVAAFLGPQWQEIYAHALAQDYRFLSYGDGSLLWRPRHC